MKILHHIWTSRLLAAVVFTMVLVLTPRAWIDPASRGATEEVPVQTLEEPANCLWCDTPPAADCDDAARPSQIWLNPDEPLPRVDAPCAPDDTTRPSA